VGAAPPRAGTARRPVPWLWIGIGGAVGTLLLMAVGAWLLFGLARRTAPAAPAASATPPPPTVPVTATAASVLVLATPWGELVSLRDAAGREMPLPARRETPLVLALPAGHYVATLRHPNAAGLASCQVDAVRGQSATCRADLLPIEPLEYFKEAGWWR